MSSKMSSIKCELQQNIYIKQEYNIDESTEYNGSNDGEFTYQWPVQDSKYTTENVKAQIKTEVGVIDDVIHESFFERENYNYDPSIIMCQTSTTNYIKSKPTNCNLNTKASTLNLTPHKHKMAINKKNQYYSQIEIKSEKPYKCKVCYKSFTYEGNMKTHLVIHTKEKPYKCFICNKSFSQASTLITHKKIHNAEKPFNCDICKKSFVQKVNMKIHIMMHHMGEKSNNKTCNKTISLKEFNTKTLSDENPYKCNVCYKSFSLKGTLKTHLWIHVKDKPYKCFICNKSFSQASTLITHKKIHNAEKPFNCDICKKSFAQKVNIKNHMMYHTGEKPNNKTCNKTISLKEFNTKTLSDENPYKSVICNKLMSQGTTVRTQKKKLNAVIPFKCHICSKSYTYEGSMETHLVIHNKEKPYKCNI